MRRNSTTLAAFCSVLLALGACGDDGGNNNGDGDAGNNGGGDGGAVAGEVRIDGFSPDHGPLAGGTVVTVTGAGFVLNMAGDAMVLIGGVLAPDVTIVDDTTAEVTVPSAVEDGAVDVTLFNANGFITVNNAYSYNPLPTITALAPPNGDIAGGTSVTVSGTGFSNLEAGTNGVMFGGTAGTSVTVVSDTELTVTSPSGEAFSLADVQLSNDNGDSGTLEYRYHAQGLLATTSGQSINRGRIYFVDPSGGATRYITDVVISGERVTITGLAAMGTTIYGVTGFNFIVPRSLVTIDPWTGETTVIGPLVDPNAQIPQGGPIGEVICHDITFIGNALYCNSRDTIYTVNLADGECTLIGSTGNWSQGNGAAYDGTTYYEIASNSLYSVNPADAVETFIIGITTPSGLVNGLTYFNGAFYATEKASGGKKGGGGQGDSRLLSVDIATGATAEITLQAEMIFDALVGTPAY